MRKLKFVFVLSFISILAFAQTGNSFKNTAITINENAGKIDTTGTEFGVYSNFTFIPGNKLLFYDDFATGALGDFPVNWETGGSGEVVQPVGTTEKWLSLQRRSGYLPVMDKELPENYTIEFDMLTNGYGKGKPISKVFFAFLPKKAYSMGRAGSVADLQILLTSYLSVANVENFGSEASIKIANRIDRHLPDAINTKIHFLIAVNKKRLRIWLNEEKYVDAPTILQGKLGRYFIIEALDVNPEKGQFAAITNFRIAEATEDDRTSLLQNGKFSTTGIYFNTNSSVIKRESYAVLANIAALLKNDPALKLNIIGHTDSDGDNDFNLDLSKRRAMSVKNSLTADFGIDDNQLSFEGKGETEPAEDNSTPKGKANNRRVEFIKM